MQQRRRIYILLVHKKCKAEVLKTSYDFQAYIDQNFKALDDAYKPDPKTLLFPEHSKEVQFDRARRGQAAKRSAVITR